MTARKFSWLTLMVVILVTIGCDRVTKHAATMVLAGTPERSYLADTVRLGYAENPGGFLSLGAEWPPAARAAFFTVVTGSLLVGVVVVAVRRRWDGWLALGLALFVAGGASNWLDRILRGRVVDFLNLGLGAVRTGVFNVADVAIMFGAGILLFAEVRRARDAPRSTDS